MLRYYVAPLRGILDRYCHSLRVVETTRRIRNYAVLQQIQTYGALKVREGGIFHTKYAKERRVQESTDERNI